MIKSTSWSGGTDEEYETQHFGFGTQRFKIAVRQMVEQKITAAVKGLESFFKESMNLNETDKATVSHSCNKLIRLYCERAGPSLDIIDEEIDRVLKIPKNVLLPEDEAQLQDLSDIDYNSLREEVSALRKRVERGALMESLLIREDEKLSAAEKVCEMAEENMEEIDLLHKSVDASDSLKTMLNETQFLCASVPSMKKADQCKLFED